ncbi:MAG TPA: hypothetical protein VJK02_02980 [Anaerolineales bacterium]|nr:hypothetical protein [Anaerolineales bacterium]
MSLSSDTGVDVGGYGAIIVKIGTVATLSDGDGGPSSQGKKDDHDIDDEITKIGPVITDYNGEMYALIRTKGL